MIKSCIDFRLVTGFILLLLTCDVQAQHGVKAIFQESHSRPVTHLVASPDGKWFYSADEGGKILMWDASAYTVHKKLDDGDGFPVKQMRMQGGGQVLFISKGTQGMQGIFGSKRSWWAGYDDSMDSVKYFRPFSQDPPRSFNASYDILSACEDSTFMVAMYKENDAGLGGHDRNNADKRLFFLPLNYAIHFAATDRQRNRVIMAGRNPLTMHDELTVYDYGREQVIHDQSFAGTESDRREVLLLELLNDRKEILVLTYNVKKKRIEIDWLDADNYKSLRSQYIPALYLVQSAAYSNTDKIRIVVKTSDRVMILEEGASGFEEIDLSRYAGNTFPEFENAVVIPVQDRLVIFSSIHSHFSPVPQMQVFDLNVRRFIRHFASPVVQSSTAAYILSNDDWLIVGTAPGSNTQDRFVKHYRTGSLLNTFREAGFWEQLTVRLNRDIPLNTEMVIDEHAGVIALTEKRDGEVKVLLYDVAGNSTDLSFRIPPDYYRTLKAYRHRAKRLLLTDRNGEVSVMDTNKIITLEGKFRFAEISNDGNFLLLVNNNHLMTILNISSNQTVFSRQLSSGQANNMRLGTIDDAGFWCSFTYYSQNKLQTQTLLFEYKGRAYEELPFDHIGLMDVAYKGDVMAMLVGSQGIFFSDNRSLLFPGSLFPFKIQLNSDGSRLLASMNDGTIRLYDVATLAELAVMKHPDATSQIITTHAGYYTANTDVRQWLNFSDGNTTYTLRESEPILNRPDKVLEVLFQSPDKKVYELLKRSVSIRTGSSDTPAFIREHSGRPMLNTVLVNGKSNPGRTDSPQVSLEFSFLDTSATVTSALVLVNGVPIYSNTRLSLPAGRTHTLKAPVGLSIGENIIQVSVLNEYGYSSNLWSEIIERTDTADKKPDLYLLAIGVSEYAMPGYNLTFADKDAYDISMLYGNADESARKNYMDEFFGERYSVQGTGTISDFNTIQNFIDQNYIPHREFIQADHQSRFWVELFDSASEIFLWDFNTGERKQILLKGFPEIDIFSSGNEAIIPDPDNRHIIYVNKTNELSLFNVLSGELKTYPIANYKFTNIKAIGGGRFLAQVKFGSKNYDDAYHKLFLISTKGENLEVKETGFSLPRTYFNTQYKLLAASRGGEKLLFAEPDAFPTRLMLYRVDDQDQNIFIQGIEHNSSNQYAFKGDTIYCLRTERIEGPSNRLILKYYTLLPTPGAIDSLVMQYGFDEIQGININSGALRWLRAEKPLAEGRSFNADYIRARMLLSPRSFAISNVKHLTNQEANSKNIRIQLENFFSSAKPEDQVVLFVAGHGMLDNTYNYYFAPHDMQFLKPETRGIAYQEFINALSLSPALRKLLILDTCHSGEVSAETGVSAGLSNLHTGVEKRGLQAIVMDENESFSLNDVISLLYGSTVSNAGVTVLSASAGYDVAYEFKALSNGALTTSILELVETKGISLGLINKGRPPIPLSETILLQVRSSVLQFTDWKQMPNFREINRLSNIMLW